MRTILAAILLLLTVSAASAGKNEKRTFVGIALGTNETEFLSQNKDATPSEYGLWSLFTKLQSKGMSFYECSSQRKTSSGIGVKVLVGFYQGRLSIISSEYVDYVSVDDLVDALTGKYGKPTDYTKNAYDDPIAGETRIVEHLYWENDPNVIVDLYHIPRILMNKVILADKAAQVRLLKNRSEKNKSLVE